MRKFFVFLVLAMLLTGCTKKTLTPTESPIPQPAYSVLPTPLQSPLATPNAPVILTPPSIDDPIYVGDVEVRGKGPSGLPIVLYDVGVTGNELGRAVIGEDNTFVVSLSEPLSVGQRVGLALGDLTGTSFTHQQLRDYVIIDLPVIGFLFADISVQSK